MTKSRIRMLVISLALAFVLLASSVVAVNWRVFADSADTTPIAEPVATGDPAGEADPVPAEKGDDFDVAVLEKYYEEKISSPEMMTETFFATTFQLKTPLNEHTYQDISINPAFDNVTISFDFTRLKVRNYTFGFRFIVKDEAGNYMSMSTVRQTARMEMRRTDGNEDGELKVKVYTDEFYTHADNARGATANVLGTNVGTTDGSVEAKTITVTTAGNINTLAKSMFNVVGYFDGSRDNDTAILNPTAWRLALRKVTLDDGTVRFRYYECGSYQYEIEFDKSLEVVGYAPESSMHSDDHCKFDNFKVTLGETFTEEEEKELNTPYQARAQKLKENEELSVTYVHFVQQNPSGTYAYGYPAVRFNLGEKITNDGVMLRRFQARLSLSEKKEQSGVEGSGTTQAYLKGQNANFKYPASKIVNGSIYTIYNKDTSGSSDVATGLTAMYSSDVAENLHLTYRIQRLANIYIDASGNVAEGADGNTEYQVYAIYENGTYLYDMGFPVTQTITITCSTENMNSISYIKSLTTPSTVKDIEKDARPEGTELTAPYADIVEGASVRFSADTQGLRFRASLDETFLKAMRAYYGEENVTFGIKLERGDGAVAYIEAKNYSLRDGKYTFNGVVANISPDHYDMDYTPYIYVRYVDLEDEPQTIITKAGEAANIKSVAEAMLADVTTEADETHVYEVTIGGETKYSPYTQAQIDVAKKYAGVTN